MKVEKSEIEEKYTEKIIYLTNSMQKINISERFQEFSNNKSEDYSSFIERHPAPKYLSIDQRISFNDKQNPNVIREKLSFRKFLYFPLKIEFY